MEKHEEHLLISNVSKTYSNGVRALDEVSLKIPIGMYGLLGPNGAGKSTLMRTLATLQEPDGGEIYFAGLNLLRQKELVRQSLGYLPQDFGVYPKATAEDLLDYFAVLKGFTNRKSRKEVIESLLKQTNLWEKRRQKLGGYSGGMRQRFGVAVALLGNPKLLIVDEPTAGLDPLERVRFLNLLGGLSESSVVILSTHIVEDVSELCTNLAIINNGQILLEAKTDEAVGALEGKVWRKVVEKELLEELSHNYQVISAKFLGGNSVVNIFSENDPGKGFESIAADLEDVYFTTLAGFQWEEKL